MQAVYPLHVLHIAAAERILLTNKCVVLWCAVLCCAVLWVLLTCVQGTAARWDAQRRADAELAVQQALANWRQLQQQQKDLAMGQYAASQQQQQQQSQQQPEP
jgi:hypothetical protein